MPINSQYGAFQILPKAIAGSAYTVTTADFGRVITNRGGGALTVTLPKPGPQIKGNSVWIYSVAAGDVVIQGPGNDQLVAKNDASATSVTIGTDNEEIGNGCEAVCDGTSWLIFFHLGAEASTTTIGA